jgi:cytoskeletal protein RodZ
MTATDRKTNRQRPWEPGNESEGVSFGNWLRRQREMREIRLGEIAEVTKISRRYLEALEQDRFDILPAPVFAKGFLREYASFVGLDPDEVVNSYLLAQRATQPHEEARAAVVEKRSPTEWTSGVLLALLVVVLLVLVALLAFYAERSRSNRQELPTIAAPPPEPAPELPVQPGVEVTAAPIQVTMDFIEDCWVEIVVDGDRRLSKLHVHGESLQIEAEDRVRLRLGNPDGVQIEVNGWPYATAASGRRQPQDLEIDLETVRTLEQNAK